MSTHEIPPAFALFRLATGFYMSQAVHLAARLGIADLLADGPRDAESLGATTGTHASSLRRVLRLLASGGVLEERDDGSFALTDVGEFLREDAPGSMRSAVLFFGGITQRAWSELPFSVETGEPGFQRVFGADLFGYLAEHPDEAAAFDAAMADFTRQIGAAVAAAYDFSAVQRVVDVGGGNGALLASVLQAHPHLRGTVFDLPGVAERAERALRELGLDERCDVVAGDFFDRVPEGGDAYLLKHILHDWDDGRATTILRTCRSAMACDARLLVVEGVYPARVDTSDASRGATSNDVNMLVSTGGRQRSEAEFRELYRAAGFRLTRALPTTSPVRVIEGVPG